MDLFQYIRLFRKWLWLIALAAFIGGSITYIMQGRRQETYSAQATLFIGNYIDDPNASSSQIYTGQQLVQTYAVMATSYEVLQATVEENGFPISASSLRGRIVTTPVLGTTLLELQVTYTDPVLAADMANALAEQLVKQSPTQVTPEEQNQIDFIERQIETVNEQIEDSKLDLDLTDQQLGTVQDDDERNQLLERRDVLLNRIQGYTATLAQLTSSRQNLQRRTNIIQVWEQARIPGSPAGTSNTRLVLIGMVVGAALAAGGALLIEYLNDTVRTPEEATASTGLPVLGIISQFGKATDPYPRRLVTHLHPSSPISEGYRALRTNLMFLASQDERHGHNKAALVVTSPGPEEGKSVTIANLAVVMASAGLRVLLVDADLRRPRQHEIFDLDNKLGLTTLLFTDPTNPSPDGGMDEHGVSEKLRQCVQNTAVPRLKVITSGFVPVNPTEILGSTLMRRWFDEFISSGNFDVVLFDTPPALAVTDSTVLATTVDASMLVVFRAGRTRRGSAVRIREQMETLNVDLLGIALNHINWSEQSSYYYGYYYYYYKSENEGAGRRGWRRFLPNFINR